MTKKEPRRRRHLVPGPVPLDDRTTLGEEALHFTRWFLKSKYHLMGGFLGEITGPARDPERLRARFARALHHAERVHRARAIVTLLLALGILASAVSAFASASETTTLERAAALLRRAAAVSTSLTLALLVARLLLDRYLERCDVAATFLAVELATSKPRGE